MRCLFCNSRRILRFIDGFGERRIFCKACGRSFLERSNLGLKNQTSLLDFRPNLSYRQMLQK